MQKHYSSPYWVHLTLNFGTARQGVDLLALCCVDLVFEASATSAASQPGDSGKAKKGWPYNVFCFGFPTLHWLYLGFVAHVFDECNGCLIDKFLSCQHSKTFDEVDAGHFAVCSSNHHSHVTLASRFCKTGWWFSEIVGMISQKWIALIIFSVVNSGRGRCQGHKNFAFPCKLLLVAVPLPAPWLSIVLSLLI